MSFSPYLHFQGNCAEAMQAYANVFGAKDLMIMRYKDAPPNDQMPPSTSDRVMHAHLTAGGQSLMASDFPEGMKGEPQSAVSVSHATSDLKAAQSIFDKLATGGTVVMPFGPTFFSMGFGMVKDRFGTHWMIMGPEAQG